MSLALLEGTAELCVVQHSASGRVQLGNGPQLRNTPQTLSFVAAGRACQDFMAGVLPFRQIVMVHAPQVGSVSAVQNPMNAMAPVLLADMG